MSSITTPSAAAMPSTALSPPNVSSNMTRHGNGEWSAMRNLLAGFGGRDGGRSLLANSKVFEFPEARIATVRQPLVVIEQRLQRGQQRVVGVHPMHSQTEIVAVMKCCDRTRAIGFAIFGVDAKVANLTLAPRPRRLLSPA